MPTTRVLIAVKTYPTLSEKYDELVCTAGFLEDGTWIRIYPIPFRKLSYDKRYTLIPQHYYKIFFLST